MGGVAATRPARALQVVTPRIHNGVIAEWLALEAERAEGHLQRALRRASRAAFMWPIEVTEVIEGGRSLTELPTVGRYIERLIKTWLKQPPDVIEPPPIRRNFLTMAQAEAILAKRPDWAAKYRGDLQMHSTWSDGAASIQDMAETAFARSYSYIAITDHSKGLKIAGGIDEAQLAEQAQEISRVNEQFARKGRSFQVLRAVELNLNPYGEGDMEPAALEQLDLVVGSFHSALRKTEDQTERYLAALNNPHVHILGHPRGRIYNHRLGLQADWKRVFKEAARLDKALELDAYADRQDLDLERLLLAGQAGARISVDTDAHHPLELEHVKLGLAAVLLAGIPEERIINFMPVRELLEWARKPRRVRAQPRLRQQNLIN